MNQLDYNLWLPMMQQKARNARFSDKGKESTVRQRSAVITAFKGISRDTRLRVLSSLLCRDVRSVKSLSYGEAKVIIEESVTPEFQKALHRPVPDKAVVK